MSTRSISSPTFLLPSTRKTLKRGVPVKRGVEALPPLVQKDRVLGVHPDRKEAMQPGGELILVSARARTV